MSKIFMPNLSEQNRTTKDYIINLLSEESKLSTRMIEKRIKKRFSYFVSYQAVRKAVINLMDQKVIVKDGRYYSFDPRWMQDISDFAESLKSPSTAISPKEVINSKKPYFEFFFDTLMQRREYVHKFEKTIIPLLKNPIIVIQMSHGFFTALNQPQIKERLSIFRRYGIKLYLAYEGNSFLDRLSASIYRKEGCTVKLGASYRDDSWISIYDDYILQTVPSQEHIAMEKDFFSKTRKFDNSYFQFMENFYFKKLGAVKVIIQRNPIIAERMRLQILSAF